MPITEYIAHKAKHNKVDATKLKKSIALIKLLLIELLPKVKFNLVTLHDLYRLIDVSLYPYDFFCLNQDNIPKAMLLYYILRVEINNILEESMSNLHEGNTQSYKHLQLEPTAENKFIADQHNLIPGISKEYMSVFLQGPIKGSITKVKQLQITEKISKVLVNLAKLNTQN